MTRKTIRILIAVAIAGALTLGALAQNRRQQVLMIPQAEFEISIGDIVSATVCTPCSTRTPSWSWS